MKASTRRAAGAIVLLVYLPLYIALAVTIAGALGAAPPWAQLLFYAVAGLAWIAPVYPLFKWMRGPA